jgi:putative two-component system response regulator
MNTAPRILIAEDSRTQAEMLRRLLVGQGYDVLWAEDGLIAWQMAQTENPDLIISDISMPNMDGYELCQHIRDCAALKSKPVILLTALSDIWDVIRGLNAGADNYLTKPYDAQLLLERVADALQHPRIADETQLALKVNVSGEMVEISAGPNQLFNLLLSTYRNAIDQNRTLQMTQDQLARLNSRLEEEVERKSHDLIDKERALSAEVKKSLEEKTEHLKELRVNLVDSVTALAETVELRDPYTAGHQKRVADLAVEIAREMGLSEDEIEGLRLAGVVHDIGKIRIPVEILAKPGRLDPEEMALIRLHPEAGYQILKSIHFPWPIAEIVRQHHERMDGSGYPKGGRDGEILQASRIIAVADVVDAMSLHRPYRPALGIERAIDEIKKGSGSRYDAAAVDACLRVIENGKWTAQT